ncbi:Uncharacterized conserved protein YndB, AHSA1/START domain [Bacillus sp. OV322]|nr:SRPBCC domain-containing protein [Bacillus sp. OV322]SFC65068.1 Uncharacterized conserved protein YndB, AHSA1/START domain [Bacillus sp. OV322]
MKKMPEIQKKIVLNAPIEKVWKAAATSEGIASWWMPNTFEPVVGQSFVLQTGQFGDSPCTVTELEPPYRVGIKWGKDWHLTFELKKLEDEKTLFTLTHSGWDEEGTTEFGQPHAIVRAIMDNGWDKIISEKLPAQIEA